MGYQTGIITFYHQDEGYGFLYSAENDLQCFFHISEYSGQKNLEIGDVVTFKVGSSDRGYNAKEIRLIEIGKNKEPSNVGVTCWAGPSQSGDYGLLNHKGEKGDGTFIHKTSLVDGTYRVESNNIYMFNTAKSKDRYIALNARKVYSDQEFLIEKIAYNEGEDARIRLKALELLSISKGQERDFAKKIQRIVKTIPSVPIEETTLSLPFGMEFTHKGTPSDNTVKIVKTLSICSVIISGLAVANKILNEI